MSDLQIGLLVIGAAVVVGVLLFNWLQERRFRKQIGAAFQTPVADPLLQPGAAPRESEERIEPALREPVFDAGEEAVVVHIQRPPEVTAAAAPPAAGVEAAPRDFPAPPVASPAAPAPYDELIEYRVRVAADGVAAGAFVDAFNKTRTLG